MEESSIEITAALPEDAEGIQNVFYKTWLATYPNEKAGITASDIEYLYKDSFSKESLDGLSNYIKNLPEDEHFFIARDSDKAIFGACRVLRKNGVNQLQAIYVLPGYQGMGIGSRLWDAVKGTLNNDEAIVVEVATYNNNAISFYEKLGFEDTGERSQNTTFQLKNGAFIPEMRMRLSNKKI